MSHEIRTPLNALSGFSSILTEESIDNETRKQCSDIIQQNSELLLKLINDVIDLSSLEVGKMKFKYERCDAVAICRNVIDMVEKIKQTNANVRFSTSLHSLELTTDNARLQQLLINLLINATKFTPQGSITMELEKQTEDIALFSVTDTGCGISPENQNKIFNRFEKLNENAQGTGLVCLSANSLSSSWAAKYGLTPIMRKEPVSCSHTPFTMSNKERRKPNETSPAPDPSIMLHPHRKSQHRDCFGIRQPDKGVGNITVRYDTAECSQSNHQIEQNNQQCIQYSDALMKEALQLGNDKYAGLAAYYHILYYYNRNNQDSVAKWLTIMEPHARKSDLWNYFFDAKRFQIDLYTFNEQYELAINESQKMQQQASQMNSNRGSMAAYQCLSNAYIGSQRWDKGIEALEAAYQLLTPTEIRWSVSRYCHS